MKATERIALRLTRSLHALAAELFYLDCATDDEIRIAILSILGDLYDTFDRRIPLGTRLPYRRD